MESLWALRQVRGRQVLNLNNAKIIIIQPSAITPDFSLPNLRAGDQSPAQAKPVHKDRYTKHRYRKSVRCWGVIQPQTEPSPVLMMCTYIESRPNQAQAKPVYEDRCAKHRYQKLVGCRAIKPHTSQSKPSQAMPKRIFRAEPSQTLFINAYTKKGVPAGGQGGALFYQQYIFNFISVTNNYI